MKHLLSVMSLLILAACGSGGPTVPDWKSDSVELIERYKKHALLGEISLSERYFQQAIRATGGAGRVSETARLWLVRCATRRASLLEDQCKEYAELARIETRLEDRTYYQFVMLDWGNLDPAKLPPHYAALVKAEPGKMNAHIAAIQDPLSRLLAASLMTLRKQADSTTWTIAADTASEQGWRQPLLTYLKLLEKQALAQGLIDQQQAYAVRIRLIESALAAPAVK